MSESIKAAAKKFLGAQGVYYGHFQPSIEKMMATFAQKVADEQTADLRDRLGDRLHHAIEVHIKMVTPTGPHGQTVHACPMCEALNALYGELQEATKDE